MASLNHQEYIRYGRQMLLPEIGKPGQLRLKSSSVLVIGLGGLGCPCVAYLAGAGIGRLGLVDADTIDLSNCHRQILHHTADVDLHKVDSAARFVEGLNQEVHVVRYKQRLLPSNALEIAATYDLILDCTDNQPTRYLISDVCVLLGKPLISGSALKLDGQLSTLNYHGGPCYRCLFPVPSPATSVQSCGEAGVLGPVVGIIGVMQALEAIKLIIRGLNVPLDDLQLSSCRRKLLLFSAFSDPQWRCITLRMRKKTCAVCGDLPSITRAMLSEDDGRYAAMCRASTSALPAISPSQRLSVKAIINHLDSFKIIDIRDETQFEIAALPNSENVPLDTLEEYRHDCPTDVTTLVVCRFGNDSQHAVKLLTEKFTNHGFKDLIGGLNAYSNVDSTMPRY